MHVITHANSHKFQTAFIYNGKHRKRNQKAKEKTKKKTTNWVNCHGLSNCTQNVANERVRVCMDYVLFLLFVLCGYLPVSFVSLATSCQAFWISSFLLYSGNVEFQRQGFDSTSCTNFTLNTGSSFRLPIVSQSCWCYCGW